MIAVADAQVLAEGLTTAVAEGVAAGVGGLWTQAAALNTTAQAMDPHSFIYAVAILCIASV